MPKINEHYQMHFIKHPFLDRFNGDLSYNPHPRQTPEHLFCLVEPCGFPNFKVIHFNLNLAKELGFPTDFIENNSGFFAGNVTDRTTYATAYAGHQFGQWAGQLGDGRAIVAGEISNLKNTTNELQWKGAGITPYSRNADGKAVLRSSVREYLMSEAMHHLNIPTTRALSICFSGEEVMRDPLYNGNITNEKGAVVMRSAPSFLRFGHLELLMAQNQTDELKKLVDWVIERYYPEIETTDENKYKTFYKLIAQRTQQMIIHWQRVGFVHGVMNTDNFSLLGLTIDYGPFSFLDVYDENFTPNTSDRTSRYAYGKQAHVAKWNLTALANALMPLIDDVDFFETELDIWSKTYLIAFDRMMTNKLGFNKQDKSISEIIYQLRMLLSDLELDFTSFFYYLETQNLQLVDKEIWQKMAYKTLTEEDVQKLDTFITNYRNLKANSELEFDILVMQKNNPKLILRNFMLQECINDLENGDDGYFKQLFEALQNPYQLQQSNLMNLKAPEWAKHTFGAGRLSCSS